MGIQFVQAAPAKVVVIRLSPGTDILGGIQAVCKELHMKSGSIVSCIGSLQRASFMVAVPLENEIGAGYSDPVHVEGPLELLAGQGSIGRDKDGGIFIHLHAVVSDKGGMPHGGHLLKGLNPVLITAEITIVRAEEVKMQRSYDPEVKMDLLMPSRELR
jgi:predicted DNA-binding protein with PD1-like motif